METTQHNIGSVLWVIYGLQQGPTKLVYNLLVNSNATGQLDLIVASHRSSLFTNTVFDLISEHALISEHPLFFFFFL